MLKFPSFFRLPKHKQFEYQPRYYDERKEELEARIRRKTEGGSTEERLKQGFRQRKTEKKKVDVGQGIFILAFSLGFVGFYYIGNAAFWALGVFIVGYIYLRRRYFS